MSAHHYIVATAGHVDHGKSALIKALTGTDPDRLPEEKTRGITIDLGFAYLKLPSLSPTGPLCHLGLVDVPGHEDFVKNMVAGVGSVDLALLVVAADDGWMPQTEEHLQILAYLGVRRAVVALTKMDLYSGNEADLVARIRAHLAHSPFANAPIVPSSVTTGRGSEDLQAALSRELAATPLPPELGKPRVPVDRVFTLHGVGTVVTGTLTGGHLHRGQAVVIQPAGRPARVRNLQMYNRDVDTAPPGSRVALNLPDIVAGRWSNEGVARGAVITLPDLGAASDTVDAQLYKSARLRQIAGPAAGPLKNNTRVRIHLGSTSIPARVVLLDGKPLLPGEHVFAQLRLDRPAHMFGGDRFVVRDGTEQYTLAGGCVLDPDSNRREFRNPAQRRLLEQRAAAPVDPQIWTASLLTRRGTVPRENCLVKSRFSRQEIGEAIFRLQQQGQVAVAGNWLTDANWWQRLQERAATAIQIAHHRTPEQPGLRLSDLRQMLAGEPLADALLDELIAALATRGFVRMGPVVKHQAHQPNLPAALQSAGARLRAALNAAPLAPPARKELTPDPTSQKALRFLLDTGEAVELSADTVLSAEAFTRATSLVTKYLRDRGPATASELRQYLGTTRRVVIPLLEALDRQGITRREGDRRVLGSIRKS